MKSNQKFFIVMNDFGLPRAVFNLLGDSVVELQNQFDEFDVDEVQTRTNGLALYLSGRRYQHTIEIDASLNSVSLSIAPLDGVESVSVFTAEADKESSWRRLKFLVMGAEGHLLPGADGVRETLRSLGFDL